MTKGQKQLHIVAEAVGFLVAPPVMYAATRMRNRTVGTVVAAAAFGTFIVDMALLIRWYHRGELRSAFK